LHFTRLEWECVAGKSAQANGLFPKTNHKVAGWRFVAAAAHHRQYLAGAIAKPGGASILGADPAGASADTRMIDDISASRAVPGRALVPVFPPFSQSSPDVV